LPNRLNMGETFLAWKELNEEGSIRLI
jgi:hypothetical protein